MVIYLVIVFKWYILLFNKVIICVYYIKMLYWKNYIKFIYYFVKYNNKLLKLFEFKCYIGEYLFFVICWL